MDPTYHPPHLQDAHRSPELLLALNSVVTEADFEDWARTDLRRVHPHEMAMFGLGVRHSLGFVMSKVIVVDLPRRFLKSIEGPAGCLLCPILHRWFESRVPQFYSGSDPTGKLDERWVRDFFDCDLRSLFVHGATSECGQFVSFLSVYRASESATHELPEDAFLIRGIHDSLLRIQHQASADGQDVDRVWKFTDREREVFDWLAAGKTNWEIGRILGISELTVKTHVQRLLGKSGCNSRAQLVSKMLHLAS